MLGAVAGAGGRRLVGRASGAYSPACVLRRPLPLRAAALRAPLVAAGSAVATVATALRAPPRFSVAFSQADDLGFPFSQSRRSTGVPGVKTVTCSNLLGATIVERSTAAKTTTRTPAAHCNNARCSACNYARNLDHCLCFIATHATIVGRSSGSK